MKRLLPISLAFFFVLFGLYELINKNIPICLLAAGVSGLWLVMDKMIDRVKELEKNNE